jgi:hypothetical protein
VAGTYSGAQAVTIKTATPSAMIVYTTDGTNPRTSKTALIYSAPITVSKTETLNAFGDATGTTTNSTIATAAYTIKAATSSRK